MTNTLRTTKINLIDFIEQTNEQLFQDIYKNCPVQTGEEEDKKLSPLFISRLLFIVYGNWAARYEEPLFANARFVICSTGAFEEDWRDYSITGKLAKLAKFNLTLMPAEIVFLKLLVKKTLRFSTWSLCRFIQTTDLWSEEQIGQPIEGATIRQWFKANQLD